MSGVPKIRLAGTDIVTSALGFGCSRLLGPITEAEAAAVLGRAHDAGVTHFDVARAYGSGDAERVLGRFVASRRDQVTITSKFGIRPLRSMTRKRRLRGLVRRAMRLSPALRAALGRGSARLARTRVFSVDEARESLETSLRTLGTDYIDVYLLHDAEVDDCAEELYEFLEGAVRSGKIRAFGAGTSSRSAAAIARSRADFAQVLQFEHGVCAPEGRQLLTTAPAATITYGALSDLERLTAHLRESDLAQREWTESLGVDCGDRSVVARLMLAYALAYTERGPVLFSSTKPDNVSASAAVAVEEPFSREQLSRFSSLATRVDGARRPRHR